jgi:hypothetical protein
VISFKQTSTILYVKIVKQLLRGIKHSGAGGSGHCGLGDGVKQGVLLGVGVGVGEAHGSPEKVVVVVVIEDETLGVGVGVGVGKFTHSQLYFALPSKYIVTISPICGVFVIEVLHPE